MHRRVVRAAAVVVLACLALVLTGESAVADSRGFPALSMPSFSDVLGWLKDPASPHWGHLPRQRSGSAAGHGHRASAASTRAHRGVGHKPGHGRGELPLAKPYMRKVAKGPSATRLGFNAKTSKRVAAKSTATSTYFKNADGSYSRSYSLLPVNYRDAAGNWQPIDTRLVRGAHGRWEEKANSPEVSFAPTGSDAALAGLTLGGGRRLSYGLTGAEHVAPEVSGSTATYPGVLPDTDLTLRPTAVGLKESIVLSSARAANSWEFPLDLKGLTPVPQRDGSIELRDTSGKKAGEIPPAYAYDSHVDRRSGERATTHAVHYTLTTSGDRPVLRVTLDAAWLHAPDRVFPVTVDPSVDNEQAITTYAESGSPGDHSMEQTIKVGSYDSGTHSAVSYLQFPGLGLDGSQVSVSAASLSLYDVWSATCTAERFDVAPVSSAWSPSSITSYPGPSKGSSIGNATPNTPNGCANSSGDLSKGDWVTVTLSASTFNTWASAAGASSDHGLAVYASTSDALHWKQFGSIYDMAYAPSLMLTYTGAMLPQVVSATPVNNASVTTLTPQLSAVAHIDPNLTTTQKYDFQVYNTSGTKLADSGNITANYYNIPAGKLTWGKAYLWEVQAFDGTNYSPGPQWQQFTTQVPQPVVTSGLSQNTDGHGYNPAVGNYTTSATDANVATPGPSLTVMRDYNSRDPRTAGAFGAGWSSVFDARAIEQYDSTGAVSAVYVTYPDGSAVGYGKNSDGSFSPPEGRFATFKSVTGGGGYTLTDKNATVYTFTHQLGSGAYGIASITDANGRAENFTWTGSQITAMASAVSLRTVHLTWNTPSGATSPHVFTVSTDPVTTGQPGTALTWSYSYTGDQLMKVCSPTDTANGTGCTQYGYKSASQEHSQTLDLGPNSFWPLSETSGTTAASAVLSREGVDNATYSNVNPGQPGPLAGSTSTAAGFNGTSSYVQLPDLGLGNSSSQTISLWFKTAKAAAGVLFSYSDMPVQATATVGDFTPSLYVGSDGKLNGLFWYGTTTTPITTSASVADNKWHHVVLSGSWTKQTMWLDGSQVGTSAGYGSFPFTGNMPWLFTHVYLGTGYLGSTWPDQPHPNSSTIYGTYFNGSIADASYFGRPLVQADVTALYKAATTPASLLSTVTRPSGKTYASVDYDPTTTAVTNLVDENGGSWSMAPPTVTGSSEVYRAAILGSGSVGYYRLGESAGASEAVDEENSGSGTYANTMLGVSGPFSDKTAASFNGTSSYVQLPVQLLHTYMERSVELWFKTSTPGVLVGDQSVAVAGATGASGSWSPILYVGSDNKVHGHFWSGSGSGGTAFGSTSTVTDNKWHHVILTVSGSTQTLYLDGNQQGTYSGAPNDQGNNHLYVGAGFAKSWIASPGDVSYFTGSIAEVTLYQYALSGEDVAAHWAAGRNSSGMSPLETVRVTDPGSKTVTYQYDPLNGYRAVAQIDGLGNKTTYGYDTSGFEHMVIDPNGNITAMGHDVRGNEVSRVTCQNFATLKCSTTYTSYLPDDTSAQLTPNPQNDLPAAVRDARSSSSTDNTYLTSYSYDAAGNRTGVTTPAVPGFPHGRTTSIAYTDGTTVPAADGGFAPKGLPYRTVSPGGATTTISYFKNGDIASMTDPDGLVTSFTYDNIGRMLTKKAVSDSFPAGLTTTYTYDGDSQITGEVDPAVTNRVTSATHQKSTSTVFDADGMILSQTVADLGGGDAPRTQSYTYTPYDQVNTTTDAAGGTTTYTYDNYGNQATVEDPADNVLSYAYDPNGKLLTQTLKNYIADPVNPSPARDLVESSRAYDPAGRLQSLTDAMGNVTSYTYTDNDLTATVTRSDPTGHQHFVEQSNTYDAAGNLTSQATNNGATTTNSVVDAANRVTSTTVDPAGVDRTTSVSYTPDDKVATTTLTDPTGTTHTTSSTYDPMGNLTSQSVHEDGASHPNAWWRLDQTSGSSVSDNSGNGNTATAGSGVTWSDGAAHFNGSTSGAGSVVATNGPVLNTASSYTVSAWVNLSDTSTYRTFVAQGGTNRASFYLQYSPPNNSFRLHAASQDLASPSAFYDAVAPAPAALNTWTHLVGEFDAGTGALKLYVNGALAATVSDPSPWSGTGPLSVGGTETAGGTITDAVAGSVDNVQLYQRPLTGTEISALYSKGRNGGTTASSNASTTRWQLDQRGLPLSMTDPDTNTTNFNYDEAGKLSLTTAPAVNAESNGGAPSLVHPTTYTGYDTFGETTEVEGPDGPDTTVTTTYDAVGRVNSQVLPDYTPPGTSTVISDATTSYQYDAAGNVKTVTDPLQHTTTNLYDQLGDLAQTTDANNGVTHTVYDANGEVQSATDPEGGQTQATYDYLGRPLTATTLERYPTTTALTTNNSYTASAQNPGGAFLASTTTPDGVTTTYGYDAVGEPTQVTDGAGNTTHTSYDGQGRKTTVTLPDQTQNTVTYDELGNPVQVASLDTDHSTVLSSQSATYDPAGLLLSTTDARLHTSTYTHDALGHVTGETQPVDDGHSITTSFGYDAAGNGTRFTDGRGNSTYYTYNVWNLPESTIEPAVTTSTYNYTGAADSTSTTAYDADGRPTTRTAPGGVSVTTGYDNIGNVTSQSGTGAEAATADRTFTYDHDNRMRSAVTAAIGTTTAATNESFTYDDRGNLLTTSGSAGTGSFTYNGDGLLTARTDAAGTTSYGYDNNDRLANLTDPATGTLLTYGYNTLNQLHTIQYGTGGDTRSYDYDHLHRLIADTLRTPGGNTVASIGYGYDPNGNETSKTTTGFAGTTNNTYGYDYANRLTSWDNGSTTTAYTYDDSGNRIRVGSDVYTYDARDQLTSDGHNTYTYSARGTLTHQSGTSGATDFASDAFNQELTQGSQTYLTDALGRVITNTGSGGVTKTFTYSGTGNNLASDGSSTYTWTPGDTLVGIGTPGGTPATAALAYTDQHNDVVGDFTSTGTALTASTGYDPLGNVTGTTGTPSGNLGYQSGWTDNATGKVNMASRWYNPATGQFMNKDTASLNPVPNSAAANPFAYVDDNPLTRTDPTGQSWLGDTWNSFSHAASHAWNGFTSAVSSGWHAVTHYASEAYDWASDKLSSAWHTATGWASDAYDYATRAFDRTMASLDREIASLNRQIAQLNREIADAKAAFKRKASSFRRAASNFVSHAAHSTYQAVAKRVNTATTYFKNHAAAIASFAVSTVVFAGCEAVVTAGSGGALSIPGAVGCGALAGAAAGLVDQGSKCMGGQQGACSVSAFATSTVLGAVGGAIGGGVGGALGGKLAESAIGGALPKLVTNVLEGATIGGVSGGATGAADYGLTCSETHAGCSWSGAADATADATVSGAVGGAAGGVLATAGGAVFGRRGCGATHSFTGTTQVVMADGSTRPIQKIKVGDKIKDSVPGEKGTQTHTVTRVIVTHTDHDFVDVTIAPTKPKPGLGKRILTRAAVGLAASAAVITTAAVTPHPHTDHQQLTAATVAEAPSTTTSGGGTLTTTYHHPFFDRTQSAFVDAKDLHSGDVLQTPTGTATVTAVRLYHAHTTTYDLTIGDLHTYYVEAGSTPVLVHNCGTEEEPAAGSRASLSEADQKSYDTLKAAVGRARANMDAVRDNLGANQAGRTDVKFYIQRMWAGSALENAVAQDPEVLADSNITHLGTSEPGKKLPDFVIGDSYNVDVTGASKTSIAEHMGRDYYEHPDQLMTYPTLKGPDIAEIFGGVGE
ncbi:LamG-like jellyroll fold domain-containing protein [Streptomyces sp. NPDC001296]